MMSAACVGMADALLGQHDTERALDFGRKALQEAENCGDCVERGVSCRAMGDIMLARGDRAGATGYFERSVELLRETREEEDLNRAREGLREANG